MAETIDFSKRVIDSSERVIDSSEKVIDFSKLDGLVPGIVQDARSGEVLMVGFLNETSYQKTLETGFVTFWSRTRQKLWMKGETSGNRLRVVEASTDCDQDTLLFRVTVEGDGLVCHEGTVSCFTRPIALSSPETEISSPEIQPNKPAQATKESR
jgi:phosphoribosyl-ATP pyrophosphohydrolase/phosphoribosyl-AMP cyclohydrolase